MNISFAGFLKRKKILKQGKKLAVCFPQSHPRPTCFPFCFAICFTDKGNHSLLFVKWWLLLQEKRNIFSVDPPSVENFVAGVLRE